MFFLYGYAFSSIKIPNSQKVLFFVQLQTRVSVKMTLNKKNQDHMFFFCMAMRGPQKYDFAQ